LKAFSHRDFEHSLYAGHIGFVAFAHDLVMDAVDDRSRRAFERPRQFSQRDEYALRGAPPIRWTGTYKQSSGKLVDILLLITDKKREHEEAALLAEAQWEWDSDFPNVQERAREMLDALRHAGKALREAKRQAEKAFLKTKRFPVKESQ
jgi:hypothetical protein